MKHTSYKFETMSPVELMAYLNGRHYPAVERLMDRIDMHMSGLIRSGSEVHPSLFRLDAEYRELSVLVKHHMQRNEDVLFPFIYQTLEEGLANFERMDQLEKEIAFLNSGHIHMRVHLANLSEFSHGFKSETDDGQEIQVLYSELHSLDGHLYRQFYLESILLIQKVNTTLFQSLNQFYIE